MDIFVKYAVDLIYVAIAAIIIIVFAKRGFFESVFRFGRYIAAALISYFVGPSVSGLLSSKWIYNGIFGAVSNSVEAALVNTAESVDLAALIESLPFFVKQFIDPAALEAKYGATVENFGAVADDFAASVATPLSNILSNLIAYVLVYFAALVVLWIVFKILNSVFKLPILNAVNALLGGALGIITAILFLAGLTWIMSFVLGMIGFDSKVAELVGMSRLYAFFGEWELFGFLSLN